MSYLELKKESESGKIPVFQKVLETARGGFSLDAAGLTVGQVLKAGTPIAFDETTRIGKIANKDGSDVKGLLYDDVTIEAGAPLAVVTRGTVYENRLDAAQVTAAVKEKLPLIIFSKSF